MCVGGGELGRPSCRRQLAKLGTPPGARSKKLVRSLPSGRGYVCRRMGAGAAGQETGTQEHRSGRHTKYTEPIKVWVGGGVCDVFDVPSQVGQVRRSGRLESSGKSARSGRSGRIQEHRSGRHTKHTEPIKVRVGGGVFDVFEVPGQSGRSGRSGRLERSGRSARLGRSGRPGGEYRTNDRPKSRQLLVVLAQ